MSVISRRLKKQITTAIHPAIRVRIDILLPSLCVPDYYKESEYTPYKDTYNMGKAFERQFLIFYVYNKFLQSYDNDKRVE